jgi:hypothetical protein
VLDELNFADPDRLEAESAARELCHQLARLGVPLDDLEVITPCRGCGRHHYALSLGVLHLDDIRTLTEALRRTH